MSVRPCLVNANIEKLTLAKDLKTKSNLNTSPERYIYEHASYDVYSNTTSSAYWCGDHKLLTVTKFPHSNSPQFFLSLWVCAPCPTNPLAFKIKYHTTITYQRCCSWTWPYSATECVVCVCSNIKILYSYICRFITNILYKTTRILDHYSEFISIEWT